MGILWPSTTRKMVQTPVVLIHAKGSLRTRCDPLPLATPKQHFQISRVRSWFCSCLAGETCLVVKALETQAQLPTVPQTPTECHLPLYK